MIQADEKKTECMVWRERAVIYSRNSQSRLCMEAPSILIVRFGPFEFRPPTRELFKHGVRLKLPPQAFEVLRVLLERKDQVVPREEFRRLLWPADTFVDFDQGLYNAIKRIREALSDSAEAPRYIETLPRLGYRFVGKVEFTQRNGDGSAEKSLLAATVPGNGHNAEWVSAGSGSEPAVLIAPAVSPVSSRNERRVRSARTRAWYLTWTLGSLSCAVLIAFVYARFSSNSAPPRPLNPVPLTASPGIEERPAFSPDGTQIAFAWKKESSAPTTGYDLYVKVIGSDQPLRLTNHPSLSLVPAWSPDNTEIAFQRVDEENTGIYLVSPLGGPERKLRANHTTSRVASLNWASNGRWIAYTDATSDAPEDHERVFLLSPDTLASAQILHAPECTDEWSPAFSPDSSRLAYVCYLDAGGFAIYTLTPPAGRPQLLKRYTGWPWGIAFTSDGQRLILSRFEGGDQQDKLYEVSLGDGSLRQLGLTEDAEFPAVSARGGKLAFETKNPEGKSVNIWRRDLRHPEAAVELVASTRDDETPQFSPDGKHIAFTSNRGGNWEIWVTNADGSELTQVSRLGNRVTGSPRWSPDGRKLVFDSGEFGAASVYIADLAEQMPRKLVSNVRYMSQPSWSLDGKWIYFVGNGRESGGIIYRCPAGGGEATALSSEHGSYPQQFFNPDKVYFATRFDGKTVLKTASTSHPGSESEVEGMPRMRFVTDWTVVQNGVYFVPADNPKVVRYFDFRTRRIRDIFRTETAFAMGLSASIDRRWLIYPQIGNVGADILWIDHFR